ncbi:MAG TPA: hypothetical protein VIR60_05305 [Gammaproteobacteria bacterium]
MSDHTPLKPSRTAPVNIMLRAAFASALSVGVAHAGENPFGQSEVDGYLVADSHDKAKTEGKCGEGKCGAMGKDTKANANDAKVKEGMCGAHGKAQKEGDQAATPETPDNAVKPE